MCCRRIELMMKEKIPYILIFSAALLAGTAYWIPYRFGPVTIEQILFHLYMPLDSDAQTIIGCARYAVVPAVAAIFFFFVLKTTLKNTEKGSFFFQHLFAPFSCVALFASFIFAFFQLNVPNWFHENFSQRSTLYEKFYIDPASAHIAFPDKKKNLVWIFVESLEATFSNKDGENLIPELTEITKNGISFSDVEANASGGAEQVAGTGWTQAGLVAQMCGIPLRLPISPNHYRTYKYFLPNAHCLYDVLKANGYAGRFLIGTKARFAGMDIFFRTHGAPTVHDYLYFTGIKEHFWNLKEIRNDIKWGFDDVKTYELAKTELTELAKAEEPFAFGMMTMDTHFATGHFEKSVCREKYPDVYKNVISCADKQLSSFLKWLEKQDFYKNTVVVVTGDHLAMNETVFGKDARRRVFNLFLNAETSPVKRSKRKFSTMDVYPSVLTALGARIEGDKLGLGTSLFSNAPTVSEQIGDTEKFNEQLLKRSAVYDRLLYKR